MSLLFLTSCTSLLERVEMNNRNLSCIKKEGENRYSAFGIEFKKKSNDISLVPSMSYCSKSAGIPAFTGMFETNIISRTGGNYKMGNTAFFQLTILNIENVDKKYKTNQELNKFINAAIDKRILEMKNNNDPRYANMISESGKLTRSKMARCRDLFQSVQDYKARNLPKSEKYLVMNGVYKSCVISKSEVFVDISLSVRANENDIKTFDSEYLKKYIINIEKFLVDKSSQQNLHSIVTD